MSTYKYRLSDYHAVRSAEIVIDGITVLAGENGCGKSTLSRWLYYLVNGSRRFDEFLYKEYFRTLRGMLRRLDMAAREFFRSYSEENSPQSSGLVHSLRQFSRFLYEEHPGDPNVAEVFEKYRQLIILFGEQLKAYLDTTQVGPRRARVLAYLKLDVEAESSTEQVLEAFMNENLYQLQQITDGFNRDKEKRPLAQFMKSVLNNFQEEDAPPQDLQLYEDDVELLSDAGVSALFNLQRAIYIDTPMALMNDSTENVYWEELRDYILDKGAELDLSQRKMVRRIKGILQGEARMVKDDSHFTDDEELRFVSADQLVNIAIEKTATGFKTFAYLQRLLENGYLNNETLLLIDEPEVHLHPQWIVEYARLLVLINKELGLKIMLASHNPDMVAALRAIAEKENVLSTTHFYLATVSDTPHQYDYKDLGCEIGEIFSSFNIALSRINAYGNSGVQE